ncbi:hypothetical protein CPLU01_16083 [Colletotrichum plurivorum]|uniref:Uncharacterized protein n=1 Tax=Colletotrichum plurivorum TaxID=2175906 RepID=A0A8H6J0Q0_9PEZI|nr:hypothetical protein CPLU01_16083 [Colletotrichum plurivorum]
MTKEKGAQSAQPASRSTLWRSAG